jgi:TolB-like protein/class 3 adenylate cyclase/Tfp pilus assembly protein PilF
MPSGGSDHKLAVILHADVVGSTALVQRDERIAHDRIQDTFRRFSETIESYGGTAHEVRGDALLAEYNRASDAVSAAIAFQAANTEHNKTLDGEIRPEVRVGISLGEVVIADGTLTGPDVVLAQRLEQLAEPGGVCISVEVQHALPGRLPFEYAELDDQEVKGFDKPVRAILVTLQSGEDLPAPEPRPHVQRPATKHWVIASIATVVLLVGIGVAWWQPWRTTEKSEPAGSALTLPDKPSIVVLPFVNLYDDGQQDYFVDGFTNAIITHLSKFPQLFVISSTTAFTYKGKSARVTDIGRDLGVKYVLEGSVQRGADTLSVHAQLIEAETDRHVWAEQYDVPPEKVFSVQADVVSEIVGALHSTLREEAMAAVSKRSAASLNGYDLYLKARAKGTSKEARSEAIELLKQAIKADPKFLEAHYSISERYLNSVRFGMADDAEEALRLARLHADKAMAIDQRDYRGHYLLGHLYLFAEHDHDLALAEFQRALDDNPNDPRISYYMGFTNFLMGQAEEAIVWNDNAKRLNPRYPGWYNYNAALARLWVGRHEEALVLAKSGIAARPKSLAPRRILIATLVETGRMDEAKEEVAKYLEIRPNFRLSTFRNTPFKHQADQDRYFDALRKAGLPD